jgi:hypothetical protein
VAKVLLIELQTYFATDAGSIFSASPVGLPHTRQAGSLSYFTPSPHRAGRVGNTHSDGAVRPTNRQRQFTTSWSYRARSALACSTFWREDCRVRSIFRWRCSSRSALYRENRSRAASKAAR